MLTPKLRYISKNRHFLSPLFLSNSNSSSYSTNLLKDPSFVRHNFSSPREEYKEIANSFKEWFRTSKNPKFDKIFDTLNSRGDDDAAISLEVSKAGIRLTESLVLQVLEYKKDNILSCLRFFDWAAKQPHFNHTSGTCVALFKILSRAKLNSIMVDLLESFDKQRNLHRVRCYDMLVIGYSLAGKVDVALQVFGRMRFHGVDLDQVAYHVLLNALVEEGCYDVVNIVLEQIRVRGHLSKVTHSIVVKNFCKQSKFNEAECYLFGLVGDGKKVLPKGSFSVFVDALCKNNKFEHAGRLLKEFGEMEVLHEEEAYDVWITCLVQAGKLNCAMDFFNDKRWNEGYIPDVFRYNLLVCRLLRDNRLKEVCDLLLDMKESRIVPDKVTMNAVLRFFCKAGMMEVALDLYKSRAEFGLTPHSLVFNFFINMLCGDGSSDEAYKLLKNAMKQGYFPGKRTFTILSDALCREGKLDKLKDLVMLALEHKIIPSGSAYERFIRVLCRAERVEDGYLIHGELSRFNKKSSVETYSYLISGFNKASRGDLAARLLIEMQDKGHTPSDKLVRTVVRCVCEMDNSEKHFLQLLEMQMSRTKSYVRTCGHFIVGAGNARRPELAKAVYEMMEKSDNHPNVDVDILMLRCYLRAGKIADALNFFEDMIRKQRGGGKMYNTMLVGLSKGKRMEYAMATMKEARDKGLVPSLQSYEELIRLCTRFKKFDDAVLLINDMEKVGRKISNFVGNNLLLYSLKSEDLYKAWLRSRDVSLEANCSSLLSQLIAMFSGHMSLDCKAEELEEVVQKCFPLNIFSYNVMLRKLCQDNIDEACRLLKRLCLKGYRPDRWTYDIFIHGLYKHGRNAEAELWADEMLRQGYVPIEYSKGRL